MKSTKLLALLLVVVMAFSLVLAGCGKKEADEGQTVADAEKQQQEQKEQDQKAEEDKTDDGQKAAYDGPKVLDYYLTAEPQTLDAQMMWGAPDIQTANMFLEGLLRLGKEEGKVVPGVAKELPEFDPETNTYTFKLNPDAKWSDGKPVTADDFFFAWRLAVDNHAPYGFFIYEYIEGASEYAAYTKKTFLAEKTGKEVDEITDEEVEAMTEEDLKEYQAKKDELWKNVKAVAKDNGSTIEITLAMPAPYFPSLTAFPVYYPMNKEFYEEHQKAGDYAKEASGLYSNGPWVVKEWKHEDSFVLEKNPNYWNKDNINIDQINLKIIKEVETRTNLLKTGKLDGSAIQAKDLPFFQDLANLKELNLQKLVDMPDFAVFYVEFNHFNNEITQNANIRKALAYAMDRTSFVEKINLGDLPALGLIPNSFPGLNKTFREENGDRLFEDNQKEKAKEFLQKGLEELGMDKLPPLDMLIGDGDIAKKIAEKFQADWAEIGIEVNLVPLPWGEKLTRLQNGDFAMSSSGWGPDYLDPMTYLDLFESVNPNNSGKYNNPKFDELIQNAKKEEDPEKRMQYMYEAEKLLIEEDMAIAPQYFRIAHWTFKNYVTGVVHRGVGATTDFYWADIDMEAKLAEQK